MSSQTHPQTHSRRIHLPPLALLLSFYPHPLTHTHFPSSTADIYVQPKEPTAGIAGSADSADTKAAGDGLTACTKSPAECTKEYFDAYVKNDHSLAYLPFTCEPAAPPVSTVFAPRRRPPSPFRLRPPSSSSVFVPRLHPGLAPLVFPPERSSRSLNYSSTPFPPCVYFPNTSLTLTRPPILSLLGTSPPPLLRTFCQHFHPSLRARSPLPPASSPQHPLAGPRRPRRTGRRLAIRTSALASQPRRTRRSRMRTMRRRRRAASMRPKKRPRMRTREPAAM